ncbi:MAG: hypothetical protein ACRELA_16185 [Candidatus Rokuibacteriota bacterium]
MDKHGILSNDEWARLFAGAEAAVKADPNHPLMVGHPEGNPIQIRPPWRPSKERWQQGVTTVGGQRWVEGVRNPRASFKDAALANNAGWKAGVNQAVQQDRFAKGMQKVDVDEAISIAEQIGPQGYAAGAAARADKFQRRVDEIAPRMAAVTEATRRMPATTLPERIARMVNQVQGSAAAGGGASPGGR